MNLSQQEKACIARVITGGAYLNKLRAAEVEHELRVEVHVLGEGK